MGQGKFAARKLVRDSNSSGGQIKIMPAANLISM